MKKVIVTTSWDDGHTLDLKLAELLRKYRIKATFYISPYDREIQEAAHLTDDQIRKLSRDFEIGAHTMTHPLLSEIDDEAAHSEIRESKQHLEKILGRSVTSFCYPSGDFLAKHVDMVRGAGFKLGRTVERFSVQVPSNPFLIPTTVQAYRHWSDIIPIVRSAGFRKLLSYCLNWDELAIALFDRTFTTGGIFHLWGHSWEIERNGDWTRLERVFRHIANRSDIQYATNSELI